MPTLKSPNTPDVLDQFRNAFTGARSSRTVNPKQLSLTRDSRSNAQTSSGFDWLDDLSHIEIAARTVHDVQAMAEEVMNERADREFDRLMSWLNSPAKASDAHSKSRTTTSARQADATTGKPGTDETLTEILTRIANSPASGKQKTAPAQRESADIWTQLLQRSHQAFDAASEARAFEPTTAKPAPDIPIDITGLEPLLKVSLGVLEGLTHADIEQIAEGLSTAVELKRTAPKTRAKRKSNRVPSITTAPASDAQRSAHPEELSPECVDNEAHTVKPKGRRIPATDVPHSATRASRNDARGHLTLSEMQGAADPSIRTLEELKIDEAIALATGDPSVKVKVSAKADDIEALNAAEAERIRQKIRARREARTFEREARPSASRVLLEKPQQIAQSLDLDISSLIDEIEERKRNQRPSRDSRGRSHKKPW
jgi:hypothetical protein